MKPSPLHAWVRPISIAYLPGALTPAVEQTISGLLEWLQFAGCTVTDTPTSETDLILTTSRLGTLTPREDALFFHAAYARPFNRRRVAQIGDHIFYR